MLAKGEEFINLLRYEAAATLLNALNFGAKQLQKEECNWQWASN